MSTLNEITGMIRRGVSVSIVSMKKPAGLNLVHDEITKYDLVGRTYYLNVSTGIKKWRNILLRTLNGWYCLLFHATIPLSKKWTVLRFSLKKRSRRISLVHLVDLVNHISREKPDVIYFHFATHAGELIILRRIFPVPFVTFFHGFDFSKSMKEKSDEYNYPELFAKGDIFFANSTFSGEKVRQLGCPAGRLFVPGLPVDDASYPFKARSQRNETRLLTVARLVEKKGLEYSIRAVAGCLDEYPDLQYDIIGDGPLKEGLERLIGDLGCEKNIRLLRSLKKDLVIKAMMESDIFLLTSITARDGETEGLGMVLLESQLTGMPVLATRHNGFTDAVLDGTSGFLVPEADVPATVERLKWMLKHPEKWEGMGIAGRKHVMNNFSEKVYLDKIIAHLQSARDRL
jgi:colanic acid/amylovoran biosynthesis glycosyltransferase